MSIKEFGRFGVSIWLPKKTKITCSDDGTVLRFELPYPMDEVAILFNEETIDIVEFREQMVRVLDEMVAAKISDTLKQ